MRQYSSHYAIRAGRNLPDKEFRYLRTVIVTAAVHWGFSSKLCLRPKSTLTLLPLTFQHWAGVSPYTSSFDLAETCVFVKQLEESFLCGLHSASLITVNRLKAPLLPKLRGYFAEFLNEGSLVPLGILYPPTCVGLRYGHLESHHLGGFLGSLAQSLTGSLGSALSRLRLRVRIFLHSSLP